MADVCDSDNPFKYRPSDLTALVETHHDKSGSVLYDAGGIQSIARGLNVDLQIGLDSNDQADLDRRQKVFGKNYIVPPNPKTILQLMWDALQDLTLQVLIAAGILSLILSSTVGKHKETEWIEGMAILVAVFIVTFVTAINDYKKEQQFQALNAVKEDEIVKVIRNGVPKEITKQYLVVGDLLRIEVGDILPADGIVFEPRQVKIDESSMTGESDLIMKDAEKQAFLLSGTKVMEGVGKMLVIAVGSNSQAGIITQLVTGQSTSNNEAITVPTLDNIRVDNISEPHYLNIQTPNASSVPNDTNDMDVEDEVSPLQAKLNKLTIWIGKGGTAVAVFILLAMVIRYSISTFAIDKHQWSKSYISEYLDFFIVAVTVLVVAIPEGLPLAVTLSLAYSVRKMLSDNNLVRHLDACETMGNATTICSDKTGTLTTNRMTVMTCWAGNTIFTPIPISCSDAFKNIFCQNICINSTAEILPPQKPGALPEHTGNKTECSLLQFAMELGVSYPTERARADIRRLITFSSARKRMSAVIKCQDSSAFRVYSKGASEILLGLCTSYLALDGSIVPLSPEERQTISKTVIEEFANRGLRTLCLAYRDIKENQIELKEDDLELDMTCIAIVGIEDPVRPEVPRSIEICHKAGIVVRMVTGDNVTTARSIALKCGILGNDNDALVMEGSEFRSRVLDANGNINQHEFDKIWPKLRVLARSSPKDKHTLVSGLIQSNLPTYGPQVVAVTGDGTNDAPALKRADVGFAMGISGTPVAKDASDIILMDDNFSSIVQAVKWGRNVYDSIAKFLQFQLTVNLVAITLAVIGALLLNDSPLTAIQLLWVNIIMDTFASLALATEPPTNALLERQPYSRTQPLISKRMSKHIIGQSIYQLGVFWGEEMLDIPSGRNRDKSHPTQHYTMVFNTFVWLQLFNEINSRKIHDEINVFSGIFGNFIFLAIAVFQVGVQILIVQFGGIAFGVTSLTIGQWGICILLGCGSLPVGLILRLIRTKELPTWMALVKNDEMGPSRGQELWMRGLHRIRVQIRVVNAFKRSLMKEPKKQKYLTV